MATQLNQQASAWGIVIDAPHTVGDADLVKYYNDLTLHYIPSLSRRLGYDFAIIHHDCDEDEDGKPKRPHTHAVIWGRKRHTKGSVLHLFQDNIDGQIQVEKVLNLEESLRYLIHQGYDDKYQYEPKEVFTSDRTRLEKAFSNEDEDLDGEALINLCIECDFDRPKILCRIGPNKYSRWYRTIEMIIHYVSNDLSKVK